jgi:hypothetical protein
MPEIQAIRTGHCNIFCLFQVLSRLLFKSRHVRNDLLVRRDQRDFVAYPVFLFFVGGFVPWMNPRSSTPATRTCRRGPRGLPRREARG